MTTTIAEVVASRPTCPACLRPARPSDIEDDWFDHYCPPCEFRFHTDDAGVDDINSEVLA